MEVYAIDGVTGGAHVKQPRCLYCGDLLSEAPHHLGAHDVCHERADEFLRDASDAWGAEEC